MLLPNSSICLPLGGKTSRRGSNGSNADSPQGRGVRQLLLSHIVRMGGTDAELFAGVRRGGYRGSVRIAGDLTAY